MAVWRDQRPADLGDLALMSRRFPPPWTVEETDACFIVRDANGQALAYQGVTCGNPVTKAYCRLSPMVRGSTHYRGIPQ